MADEPGPYMPDTPASGIAALKARILRLKPYLPAVCFLGGFTWDNLTLRRVDTTLDMTLFAAYILACGLVIVLIGRGVRFRFSNYLPNAVQFFFGGLFSSFVVYYFKSASSVPSLLFMLGLMVLLVGNEFIEHKLNDVGLGATLYAVVCFMYLNNTIPVLLGYMNVFTFLLAVMLSLAMFGAVKLLAGAANLNYRPVVIIHGTLIVLYLLNVIPPVPPAKREMGIYRTVRRGGTEYRCTYERPPWYRFWATSEKVYRWAPGDTVYCFTSVFAPTRLRKGIAHHWYYREPGKRGFSEMSTMPYSLAGGRGDGYRGYTYKRTLLPGQWRVVLKTDDRKTLGIVRFDVEPRDPADSVRTCEIRH